MCKSAGNNFCQANMSRFFRISENAEQAWYDTKRRDKRKKDLYNYSDGHILKTNSCTKSF